METTQTQSQLMTSSLLIISMAVKCLKREIRFISEHLSVLEAAT